MIIALLLVAGFIVSATHAYLVYRNRDGVRYSISEHAIADKKSYLIYICAHILTDILFLISAYVFFYETHGQSLLFGLSVVFITLDALQSILPTRGRTESVHFVVAYISWFLYQLVGVFTLFLLEIAEPYRTVSFALLVIVISMFGYMHVRRDRLWPLQLVMVPLYFVFLLVVVIGAT